MLVKDVPIITTSSHCCLIVSIVALVHLDCDELHLDVHAAQSNAAIKLYGYRESSLTPRWSHS